MANMNIEEIIGNNARLNKELHIALSTMEKKDTIKLIREQIIENQKHCPHFDNKYNWAIIEDTCPYCGFHFSAEGGY